MNLRNAGLLLAFLFVYLQLTPILGLTEHERDRIRERTKARLSGARARGRMGGRPRVLTGEKEKFAASALKDKDCNVKEIAKALGIGVATVYRFQQKLRKKGIL